MDEYSRIIIENHCRTHSNTKKAALLQRLLKYSVSDREASDYEMCQLQTLIMREKNQNLKAAMEDLDEFLCL